MSPIRKPQGPQRPVAGPTIGPTMPPAPLDQRPSQPANPPPEDSDSDDDFGPLPPGASRDDDDSSDDDGFGPQLPTGDSAAEEAAALARLSSHATSTATIDKNKPVRDAWMLAPPTSSDIGSRMDPTKLKNRKFQTGKGARAPHGGGSGSSGPGSLWTETPDQKAARLRDEMLGIKRPAQQGVEDEGVPGDAAKRRKKVAEEEETARRVAEYTEKFRGKALVKEHQEGRKGRTDVEESDDPSKRGFDWEKDIKRGVRIGEKQKADMLKRAGGMGDRFSKGKFL
ncbi:hypothetical protein BJ508DRAFT_414790 [Ascobolus immersus RN42]|uniref:DUF3752 domain-containing protein n=1 Tax=Ascobolus immersus RN42 TaxID=1160509 RepID=A0A3N4I796_ASCIM|nr:hypothetical protein BJ508DRAFT_414790 [Ascobolus immersus RN42]